MGNSAQGGIIYFASSEYGTDFPHDAFHARTCMNNAIHLADQCGQVRVNFTSAENIGGITNTSESTATTLWHIIARFGPFRITVDTDGVPYPLRIRVGGYSSSAATQVKMRVVVAPRGMAREYVNATGAGAATLSNVAQVSTTSATPAWLTTTIAGSSGTLLTFSRAQADAAFVPSRPTVDAIGGNAIQVKDYEWEATVFGQNTGGSEVEPILSALYLAEYVGV